MNKIHKIYDYIGPDGNLQSKRFNAEKTIDVILAALNQSQESKPCDHGNGICNPKNFPCNQFTQEPKASEEISPSEALYGFAGWLTSSDISLTVGAKHEAGEMAVLVDKFCKSQGLASPRDVYPNNLKPYPVAKPQEEPKKCCENCLNVTQSLLQDKRICEDADCPCHQKETEPKEYPVIQAMNYKIEGHIVLPMPKGMRIGRALYNFDSWLRRKCLPKGYELGDEKLMQYWSQFIKSQE